MARFKRNSRGSYSINRRFQGLSVKEKLIASRYMRIGILLAAASFESGNQSAYYRLASILSFLAYRNLKYGKFGPVERFDRTDLRIGSFSDAEADQLLGFRKDHLPALLQVFQIPDTFKLNNAGSINGEEAFLFFLYRLKRPSLLFETQRKWGREYTQLSRIFNRVLNHLSQPFFKRLFSDSTFLFFIT